MAITVKCSACQQQFQVRDSLAGKSVVCRKCGADLPVIKSKAGADADAEEDSGGDYAIKERPKEPAAAAPARKAGSSDSQPVLSRRSSDNLPAGRPASTANQKGFWIYLGAGGVVLVLIVLVIKLVGTPPNTSEGDLTKIASTGTGAPPPPVYAPSTSNRGAEKPAVDTKSQTKPETTPETQSEKKGEPATKVKAPPKPAQVQAPPSFRPGETLQPPVEIGRGDRPWKVRINPPEVPLEIDPGKKILATIPKNSKGDVVFPDCPSSVVAVGSNNTPREIREVRDVQGNRRLGSIRNSAIANARVALSPDGQQFAAWPEGQNKIGVWTVKTEKPRGVISVSGVLVPRLLMFAGNERLIAVGGGEDLFVWTMPEGTLSETIRLPKINGPMVSGLSPGGRYLAVAVVDANSPVLLIFDLTSGSIAGEIAVSGIADGSPACHAVAFSPDGTELAALYESPDGSNLLAFHTATGEPAAQIVTEESLRTTLKAGAWKGGRALEWFPDRRRWFVYGRGVVDRSAGKLVWSLPRDKSGSGQFGHVLDDERLLVISTEKQDAAIVVREVPSE